ncbi:MAG: MgtC/SapB family protein [Bacteroidetes bacterium]|nr:MgtC/SapB family protein [Bacteroidota bacterium]
MELIQDLAVVLGIGLLIGLEREVSHPQTSEHGLFAGVRTFPLVALFGYLSSLISETAGIWILILAFLAVICLVSVSYFVLSSRNDIGATTEVSFLLTFILGILVHQGQILPAVISAVVVTVLLSVKLQVLTALGKFSQADFFALLKFVILAAIVLPFLPDRMTGPYDAVNPRQIGYVIVLISGISFAGYILTRLSGPEKGIFYLSVMGGIVSSTAVTWDFSKKSREDPDNSPVYAAGILRAGSVMYFRILLIVAVMNPVLAGYLAIPAILLGALGILTGQFLVTSREKSSGGSGSVLTNPLNIRNALVFALVFGVIGILVRAGKLWLGDGGIYLAGALSGLTDVDAIVLSMINYAGETGGELQLAVTVILIAAAVNTVFKTTLAALTGDPGLRPVLFRGMGVLSAASLVAVAVILWV